MPPPIRSGGIINDIQTGQVNSGQGNWDWVGNKDCRNGARLGKTFKKLWGAGQNMLQVN